jgi:hypothetical protein
VQRQRLNSDRIARRPSADRYQKDKKLLSLNPSGDSSGSIYSKAVSSERGKDTLQPRPLTQRVGPEGWSRCSTTLPSIAAVTSPDVTTNRTSDISSWSFFNIETASSNEERIFALSVLNFGPKIAIDLAARFRWKCQRPLQGLRAMMNERGKNYSGKSAKRKRPSGSPASLKKRS